MVRGEGWTAEFVEQLAKAFDIDLDVPWAKLSKRERDVVLYGTGGKEFTVKWGSGGKWTMEWEGHGQQAACARFKTTAAARRCGSTTLRFFSDKPCPTCQGERLKPESRGR